MIATTASLVSENSGSRLAPESRYTECPVTFLYSFIHITVERLKMGNDCFFNVRSRSRIFDAVMTPAAQERAMKVH
jgi:hypothetical protein